MALLLFYGRGSRLRSVGSCIITTLMLYLCWGIILLHSDMHTHVLLTPTEC